MQHYISNHIALTMFREHENVLEIDIGKQGVHEH
jgi:hypothetical protein